MAKERLSLVDTIDISFGKRQRPVNLRTTHLLAGVLLRFSATYTMTGGTGVGTMFTDALFRLFSLIQLNTGGEPQLTLTGQTINFIMQALYPTTYVQDQPSSLAAGASEAVECFMYLPLAMPHSFDPLATSLPSYVWPQQPPQLVLDVAAAAIIATGEDGAIGFTAPQLEVREVQVLDENLDPTVRDFIEIHQVTQNIAAAAARQQVYLPTIAPGKEIVRVIVEGFDNSGNDVYTDSLITHLRLIIGGQDVQEKESWNILRQINKRDYQLSALYSGVVCLDSASDKGTGPGELWYVGAGDRPYLEVTTTAAANVRVTVIAVDRQPYAAEAAA